MPDPAKMRELYSNSRYYRTDNISLFGYSDYLRNKHLYVDLFNRRLDMIIDYANGPSGRLLDVGCATGVLLELARLRGWEVQGVDLSEYATKIAREYYNLEVHTGELSDAGYPADRFDVLVMDDVIEHVTSPTALVKECHRVLKPGGLLTLNTPNRGGLWHLLMGRRWFHYKKVEHTYFFSPPVMTQLLARHGFAVLSTRASSKTIDLSYAFGRLRYYNEALSRFMMRTFSHWAICRITFPIGVGEMVVFARKES